MKTRDIVRRLVLIAMFVFFIGAVVVAEHLISRLLAGRGLPKWSLLTYIGAAFALGAGYLLAEALWDPIRKTLVDRDKVTDPFWKRALRLLAILTIVALLVAGVAVAGQRGWLPQWLQSAQKAARPRLVGDTSR